MNKIIYFTIGALVIAVITIGIIGYAVRKPVVNVSPTVNCPDNSSDCMGAVPGPRVDFPSFMINGVEHFYYSSTLSKSSTTLCSFKAPTATSTLIFASLQLSTGTTSSVVIEIGKGVNLTSTTTSFGTYIPTSLEKPTIIASTTAPTNIFNGSFGPNKYLNFKWIGDSFCTNPGCNAFVGTCKAEFIVN